MAQFKAFAPNVEVNGETVFAIVDGMGAYKATALEVLEENNIVNPRPGEWYPQQAWLDAFKEISASVGPKTLYAIGRKIPENAQFPPEIDTIEKALSAIDIAYHMNHRGGDIGKYAFTSTGAKSANVLGQNPYPCDFDRGIVETMAIKFKPAGSEVAVVHNDAQPCRKTGADSCTYSVTW